MLTLRELEVSPLGCLGSFRLEQLDGLPSFIQRAGDIRPVHSRLLVAANVSDAGGHQRLELCDALRLSTEGCRHIYGMILRELTDITVLIMPTS